jgi:exosome complex component RRP40
VNVMSGKTSLLGTLAFDGASKRNRPKLQNGDIVYCRVREAHPHMEMQLTCETPASQTKKDWSSGEALYSELTDGMVLQISTTHARNLLHPKNLLLTELGRYISFEVAVGCNGLVWLKAGNIVDSVIIRNAILNTTITDQAEILAMVEHLITAGQEIKKKNT